MINIKMYFCWNIEYVLDMCYSLLQLLEMFCCCHIFLFDLWQKGIKMWINVDVDAIDVNENLYVNMLMLHNMLSKMQINW